MTKDELKLLDDLKLSAVLTNVINKMKDRDLVGPYAAQMRSLVGYVGKVALARFAEKGAE